MPDKICFWMHLVLTNISVLYLTGFGMGAFHKLPDDGGIGLKEQRYCLSVCRRRQRRIIISSEKLVISVTSDVSDDDCRLNPFAVSL